MKQVALSHQTDSAHQPWNDKHIQSESVPFLSADRNLSDCFRKSDLNYVPLEAFLKENRIQNTVHCNSTDRVDVSSYSIDAHNISTFLCPSLNKLGSCEHSERPLSDVPVNPLDYDHDIEKASGISLISNDRNNNIIESKHNAWLTKDSRQAFLVDVSGCGNCLTGTKVGSRCRLVSNNTDCSQESETEEISVKYNGSEFCGSKVTGESKLGFLEHKRPLCIFLFYGTFVLILLLFLGVSAILIGALLNSRGILVLENVIRKHVTSTVTFHVVIGSFQEYENVFHINTVHAQYSVTFNLKESQKWPRDAVLHNSENIKEIKITGYFEPIALVNVLRQTTNLERLHLQNDDAKLCFSPHGLVNPSTAQQIQPWYIQMKVLALDSFTNDCKKYYQVLSNNIKMDTLEEFYLSNGVISDSNVVILQNILHNSQYSLTRLEFLNTNLTTPMFNWDNIGTMPKVTTLNLDVRKNEVSMKYDNNLLVTHFPNLRQLSLGSQLHSLNESRAVYGLTELRELNMSINLSMEVYNYSVAFIQSELPKLENATIFLNFEVCDEDYSEETRINKNYILDLQKLPSDLISKLIINTNGCELFTGHEDKQ